MILFNSLSRKKEAFKPIDRNCVRMYVCGPTLHDFCHIGNARPLVVYDLLKLVLSYEYNNVVYARNITDVDDKILNKCKIHLKTMKEVVAENKIHFDEDIKYLGCKDPDHEPKASSFIKEMLNMIDVLVKNGHAYQNKDGVLFSVESFKDYMKLSNRVLENKSFGERSIVSSKKKHVGDFFLWKLAPKFEEGWDSEYGYGRPGWHIECSAMSNHLFGQNFDIHGGGVDLKFPHHENEIAQSVCANKGSKFCNYWAHVGLLTVNGSKMSKSLNNFITIKDIRDSGVPGNVLRLSLLSSHYRSEIDFSYDLINRSMSIMNKLYSVINDEDIDRYTSQDISKESIAILQDDLNTSKYIGTMMSIFKDIRTDIGNRGSSEVSKVKELVSMGHCFGLWTMKKKDWTKWAEGNDSLPEEIKSLAKKRSEMRKNELYKDADKIRDQIIDAGYSVMDLDSSTTKIVKKIFFKQ